MSELHPVFEKILDKHFGYITPCKIPERIKTDKELARAAIAAAKKSGKFDSFGGINLGLRTNLDFLRKSD